MSELKLRPLRTVYEIASNPPAPGDSGAAIAKGAREEFAATRLFVRRHRQARMLPCGHFQGIRGRESDWLRENSFRRTAECRKILPARAIADQFRQFQNRWMCAPWYRAALAQLRYWRPRSGRRSFWPGRRECNGISARRDRCVRAIDEVAKDQIARHVR